MKMGIAMGAIAVVLLAAGSSAMAQQVFLGSTGSDGGLMIYYNNIDLNSAAGDGIPDGVISGYDEHANNQAYIKTQFSYSNANGSPFQFDNTSYPELGGASWNDIFSGQPYGASQFGLDLEAYAPTYNGAGGVVPPAMSFYDNVDNNAAHAVATNVIASQSLGAWALNVYGGAGVGPESGTAMNSVFRGTSFTMNITDFQVVGSTYVMTIAGELVTDGYIHWYTVGVPDTALASWYLGDSLYYTGTLVQDFSGDFGADQRDFYVGSLDIYANVVPEPASMGLLVVGLAALVARRSRKAR